MGTMARLVRITMLVIIAPSGGAKGTTVKRLLNDWGHKFIFSVSCTTRVPGDEEVEGKDYFFITEEEFKKRIAEGYFFEYEIINGDYYGIPNYQFEEAKKQGKILLFDVDVKGGLKLQKQFEGDGFLMVFIDSGDDVAVYEKRIRERKRKSDTEEKITRRVARVPEELKIGRENANLILENRHTLEEFIRLVDDVLVRKALGFCSRS